MKTIIYRKSDLVCVGTITNNMTAENEIEMNVISNFGGNIEDYSIIETDLKYFHLENQSDSVVVIEDLPSKELLLKPIRKKRNKLLAECDWTQFFDSPLSVEQKQAWATYRQALRDLPETVDVNNPIYPSKPN